MIFGCHFRAPNLESSNNKLHQIILVGKRASQNVNCASAATSSPISTLMYSVSLKTQNMKVIDLFLIVPKHLESSQSEPG